MSAGTYSPADFTFLCMPVLCVTCCHFGAKHLAFPLASVSGNSSANSSPQTQLGCSGSLLQLSTRFFGPWSARFLGMMRAGEYIDPEAEEIGQHGAGEEADGEGDIPQAGDAGEVLVPRPNAMQARLDPLTGLPLVEGDGQPGAEPADHGQQRAREPEVRQPPQAGAWGQTLAGQAITMATTAPSPATPKIQQST